MHSIFATEVAELPAELEAYYQRYFFDRKLVLQQLGRYQDEFTRREAQVATYDAQLKTQKSQIESLERSLKANLARLNSIQAQLTAYETSNDYGPYNALVPTYNALVETYNRQLDTLNASITAYNQTAEQRNSLAVEEGELLKALSGSEETEINSL
jgi:chromosome segregation ATPase